MKTLMEVVVVVRMFCEFVAKNAQTLWEYMNIEVVVVVVRRTHSHVCSHDSHQAALDTNS